MVTGTIIGYDPGGDGKHGVAIGSCEVGRLIKLKCYTVQTANDAITLTLEEPSLIGVGIDTLTCWSTGPSGWRPADRWLREKYSRIIHSVASANSLFGSMGLNGMAFLVALRTAYPTIVVSETHPKVLHLELFSERYDYGNEKVRMDKSLAGVLSTEIDTSNDHEWDAAISAFAVLQGLVGAWTNDLHSLASSPNERLIEPCGQTFYWWPC